MINSHILLKACHLSAIPLYSFDVLQSVQSYNEGGWDYTTELRKFVDGGMIGTGFIDGVSGIVNRGCHNPVSRPAQSYPIVR